MKKSIIHYSLPALFFSLLFALGLLIFDDYGISWDEAAQRYLGEVTFNYITKGDTTLLTSNIKYYGSFFETFLYSLEKLFQLQDSRHIYLMRHLVNFLLFYVATFFFFLLCKKRFNSWKLGLLGGLMLVLSPSIFSHAFYNSKDIAFLSMFIICIYTLNCFLDKRTLLNTLLHALCCAILIDIRILGILLPLMTVIFALLNLKDTRLSSKKYKFTFSFCLFTFSLSSVRRVFIHQILYFTLLIFFTILIWPILWNDPIGNLLDVFNKMGKYPWDGMVLYMGEFVYAPVLPWHYTLVWIAITVPLIYLIYFFVGLIDVIASIKSPSILPAPPVPTYLSGTLAFGLNFRKLDLIYLFWFFVPLLAVIILRSTLYDGWRHLFFIYPALLIISLRGFNTLYLYIKDLPRRLRLGKLSSKFLSQSYLFSPLKKGVRGLFLAINVVGLIFIACFMMISHPYQHLYFNRLAGPDLEHVKNNFELDYWGLSYREGLEYILANDKREYIKVEAANYSGIANNLILPSQDRKRIVYVKREYNPDYFISNYRFHPEAYTGFGDEYFSVKLEGANILVVYNSPPGPAWFARYDSQAITYWQAENDFEGPPTDRWDYVPITHRRLPTAYEEAPSGDQVVFIDEQAPFGPIYSDTINRLDLQGGDKVLISCQVLIEKPDVYAKLVVSLHTPDGQQYFWQGQEINEYIHHIGKWQKVHWHCRLPAISSRADQIKASLQKSSLFRDG